MVIGQKIKVVIAAIQHEIIVFNSAGAGEDLVAKLHAVAQHKPVHIFSMVLPSKALLTQDPPEQRFYPQLGLVAPFHQGGAAVVGGIDAGRRQKHPREPGILDLGGIHPHVLDFTGAVKRGINDRFAVKALRSKDLRIFIRVNPHSGIVHGDIGFCKAVEPEPASCLALEPVGLCLSREIGCKTLRPSIQQNGLGPGAQPVAPEPVSVVGAQQPALFERSHDRFQIVRAGRETVELAGGELSRNRGQR